MRYSFLLLLYVSSFIWADVYDGSYLEPLKTFDSHINVDILEESQKRAKVLSRTGTFLYFSGIFLEILSIPVKNEAGIVLLSVGTFFDLFGPVPSCVGAGKLKNVIKNEYGEAPRLKSGINYGRSWAFEGGAFLFGLIGSLKLSKETNSLNATSDISLPVLFFIISGGFDSVGKIYRAIASLHSIMYADTVKDLINQKQRRVGIVPIIKLDGTTGIVLKIVF